jgi:hypothetical protein
MFIDAIKVLFEVENVLVIQFLRQIDFFQSNSFLQNQFK